MKRCLTLLAAVLLALSCARREAPAPPPPAARADDTPRDGGTLVRRLESDVTTLNPILSSSDYDRLVAFYLFTPMVHFDEKLEVAPGLADRWEVSDDGRVYTFHINEKATFADGKPVRAADVLFTVRKIADPRTEAVQIASGFEQLDLARTRIVDERTIAIAFKEVLASQMIRFNDLLVVPEHVYGKGDFRNDFTSRAVGTGPYRLVRREPGKEIVVERRDDFWGERPHIRTVVFKVIVDGTTAWNALKRGDIDETMISSDVWKNESTRPELAKRFEFRRFYTLGYNFIAWNGRNPLFSDKRVRRALTMCTDLKSVITGLYGGTARVVTGPFTPDQWAYNPDVPPVPFDPAEARRILASVGWLDTNGDGVVDRNGKPFAFDLFIFSGSTTAAPFAQILQAELAKAGVKMQIVTLEPAVLVQRVLAGHYDAVYMAWDLDPDPDPFPAFHSSQFPPRGQNFVFYANPEADRLMEAARRELQLSKRKELYREVHRILAEDQPYTWTIQVSVKWAINKRVRNVGESRGWGLFQWYPGELGWWLAE
ncbi:MAG TPA: ABC transporter substrate-binding protein [Thermoanaerobaculia bacterium]|nr:ABC transporter substrate-binding protein [Thermoanaerobaculia bacterium]